MLFPLRLSSVNVAGSSLVNETGRTVPGVVGVPGESMSTSLGFALLIQVRDDWFGCPLQSIVRFGRLCMLICLKLSTSGLFTGCIAPTINISLCAMFND